MVNVQKPADITVSNNIKNIETKLEESSQNVGIFSSENMIKEYRNLYLDCF